MSYTIDETLVNDRKDWLYRRVPRQAAKRFEGYPGLPEQYVISEPSVPGDITLEGYLVADTLTALLALIDSYSAMDGDSSEHSVTYKTHTTTAMTLISFRTIGDFHPRSTAGVPKLAWRVRFHWRQLRREVVS